MHRVAEVGIAAHWRYKEGSRRSTARYDAEARLAAPAAWTGSATSSDATEFVEGLKLDIFQDQVFVFTPKGDIKELPAGATPLDFAYRIHTDVGHSCIGAKVNNRLVPLDYKLKNGDIVEIVTTKGAHGPSRDWLKIVTTSHAKEKIRQWFKRQERDENIVHGQGARWTASCGAWRGRRSTASPREQLAEIVEQLQATATLDDFYAAIGYGAVSRSRWSRGWGSPTTPARRMLPQVAPPHAGADRRHPRQGRRRPAGALRQVLRTRSPATRSSATSPAARA